MQVPLPTSLQSRRVCVCVFEHRPALPHRCGPLQGIGLDRINSTDQIRFLSNSRRDNEFWEAFFSEINGNFRPRQT